MLRRFERSGGRCRPPRGLWSGSFGCSTLITSAPSTGELIGPQRGPASTWVMSMMRMPSNGRVNIPGVPRVE